MPDINIDINYFSHRKTKRLIGQLGRGSDILPIRLWAYCGKHHSEDGRLIGYSEQEIESVCDWWGESGKMVEALLAIGWLHRIEAGFEVHEWVEHQGHLKAYSIRGKAAAAARWSRLGNTTSMPQAMQNRDSSIASLSVVESRLVPPKEKGSGEKPIPKAEEVLLAYLNEKTGRDFRPVSANLDPIRIRLAEVGGDVDGIRQMIDRQCACWKCTDQEEYLRPETLFGKTKFHGYYGAKAMPVKPNGQKNGSRPIRHADAYENLEDRPQRPLL